MEEKNIIITIENYKGRKITYTMPADGTVEIMKTAIEPIDLNQKIGKLINVDLKIAHPNGIEVKTDEILVEKEDID